MWQSRDRGILLLGLPRGRIDELDTLHAQLRDGRSLGHWRRVLYRTAGAKLVVIALTVDQDLVGFDMYYAEGGRQPLLTVHEAFVGVAPRWRGCGLATAMRAHAMANFAASGLQRVTTDVDPDNHPSYSSALSLGFISECEGSDSTRMYKQLR